MYARAGVRRERIESFRAISVANKVRNPPRGFVLGFRSYATIETFIKDPLMCPVCYSARSGLFISTGWGVNDTVIRSSAGSRGFFQTYPICRSRRITVWALCSRRHSFAPSFWTRTKVEGAWSRIGGLIQWQDECERLLPPRSIRSTALWMGHTSVHSNGRSS